MSITIGPRQTVQGARHPMLGLGRLVHRNGPACFIADSGEVIELRRVDLGGASTERSWVYGVLPDATRITFDTTQLDSGVQHDRVVSDDGHPGWFSFEYRNYRVRFEPDDDSPVIDFIARQMWVGGPQDSNARKWPLPFNREKLRTHKGRNHIFTFSYESDPWEAKRTARPRKAGR